MLHKSTSMVGFFDLLITTSMCYSTIRIKDSCWFWVLENLQTITRIHEEPAKERWFSRRSFEFFVNFENHAYIPEPSVWFLWYHSYTSEPGIWILKTMFINLASQPPWYPVGGFGAVSTKLSNTVKYLQIHNYYQNTVLKLYSVESSFLLGNKCVTE